MKLLRSNLKKYSHVWTASLLSSHDGLAFILQVTQNLARVLGAKWKPHCVYRAQSSGQVERMNWILKETLAKLTMESETNWASPLPFALYRVRNAPYTLGLTPFEIMFG